MIFRNINGELIEINRFDFKNDKLFFQKILDTKKPFTKNQINEVITINEKIKQSTFTNYIINNALK